MEAAAAERRVRRGARREICTCMVAVASLFIPRARFRRQLKLCELKPLEQRGWVNGSVRDLSGGGGRERGQRYEAEEEQRGRDRGSDEDLVLR